MQGRSGVGEECCRRGSSAGEEQRGECFEECCKEEERCEEEECYEVKKKCDLLGVQVSPHSQ